MAAALCFHHGFCKNLFSFVCTHFYLVLICKNSFCLCVLVWMLKHKKFYLPCWKHCGKNSFLTESWTLIFIIITAKSWILIMIILQLRTFKTQITKDTRALVYHGLYGSVAERINHTTFNMLSYREKSLNAASGRFFITQLVSHNPWIEPTTIPLLWIVVIQTNSRARAMFWRSAWGPANFEVELPAPREALKTARRIVR